MLESFVYHAAVMDGRTHLQLESPQHFNSLSFLVFYPPTSFYPPPHPTPPHSAAVHLSILSVRREQKKKSEFFFAEDAAESERAAWTEGEAESPQRHTGGRKTHYQAPRLSLPPLVREDTGLGQLYTA